MLVFGHPRGRGAESASPAAGVAARGCPLLAPHIAACAPLDADRCSSRRADAGARFFSPLQPRHLFFLVSRCRLSLTIDVDAAFSSAEPQPDADKPEEEPAEPAKEAPPVKGAETVVGEAENFGFQAETRQLLDIVQHSLYSDREVFLRELVSNSCDALEKARHAMLTSQEADDGEADLGITITTDSKERLLAISDNGIGMTREELQSFLGTIARSGSKAFMEQLATQASAGTATPSSASSIIGKFGVGFYSVFMVAEKVEVYSRKRGAETGHCWTSSGDGNYTLSEATGVDQGTKIIIHLKADAENFALESTVKTLITKYSSFVSFPIMCHGNKLNEVDAIWLQSSGVTKEQHTALYRHLNNAYDEPAYTLAFKTDAPLDIKSVFYIPQVNMEKFGMGKTEQQLHLYSRRVMIQRNSKDLLPEYLRFVTGVVDSEDLPMSVSRENMKDQRLLRNLNAALTKRILRWLTDEAKKDPKAYSEFYNNWGLCLKEGVAMDRFNAQALAALLRYPSSVATDEEPCSLEDYVGRMKEGHDTIYYLVAQNRKVAEGSPYYEAFKRAGVEVLFCYQEHDEIVLGNLGKYKDKTLKSIEVVEPPKVDAETETESKSDEEGKKGDTSAEATGPGLSSSDSSELSAWIKEVLSDRVSEVQTTDRLVDSPAIISDHDNAVTRRMMQMAEIKNLGVTRQSHYKLLINPSHPLVISLNTARSQDPETAKLVAEQVLDNAVISAGILDDVREMLPRLSQLMSAALQNKKE